MPGDRARGRLAHRESAEDVVLDAWTAVPQSIGRFADRSLIRRALLNSIIHADAGYALHT